jgi:hypothetical protein
MALAGSSTESRSAPFSAAAEADADGEADAEADGDADGRFEGAAAGVAGLEHPTRTAPSATTDETHTHLRANSMAAFLPVSGAPQTT